MKKLTTEIFIQHAQKIHGNKYNYSKSIYVNGNIKMEIICPIHGSFWQKSWSHISGRGCPICNSSKGELKIKRILDKKSIKYIQQKKFDECMKIKPLPFDFYLPENNICIEYDGRQHFEPIKMFGGNKAFKIRTENDKIKNQYCYDNGIKLIRIPYWEKDNISNILLNL